MTTLPENARRDDLDGLSCARRAVRAHNLGGMGDIVRAGLYGVCAGFVRRLPRPKSRQIYESATAREIDTNNPNAAKNILLRPPCFRPVPKSKTTGGNIK